MEFIAAASSLGTGGDYPGVIYIVHIGLPYGMIDFAQETGRGGRAGEDVDSIILLEDSAYKKLEKQDPAELTIDELDIQRFIRTKHCRRFAMSAYLDEEGVACDEIGGRPYDCCGDDIADWTAGQVKASQELQQFERKMDEVQRHCGFCWVMHGSTHAEHPTSHCTRTPGLNVEESEKLRNGWRVDRRCRDCHKCGVSQGLFKGVDMKRMCQWNGITVVLWLSCFHLPEAQRVLLEGGYMGQNISGYQKWLGLRARRNVHGVVVSNGMWMLWTMMQRNDSVDRVVAGVGDEADDARDMASMTDTIPGSETVVLSVRSRPVEIGEVTTRTPKVFATSASDDDAAAMSTVIEAEDIITR